MPTDAYVKFGESDGKSPHGTPLPAIEGDSSDEMHYWWCELRNCGFNLDAAELKSEQEDEGATKDHSTAKFPKVTLKKRVDWASTQLFMECCEQAMALSKPKEEQEKGWIDKVTVDVCRPAGGTKIPFLIVEYYNVRITRYEIDMGGPEPTEEITFEFRHLEFKYAQTDPYTGKEVKGKPSQTGKLANAETGQGGTAGTGTGASGSTTGGTASTGGTTSTGATGPAEESPNGAPAAPAPTIDAAVSVNFPGFWQGTGFGVLPD